MRHVVALAGRPNVGKSTLFNQLTGTRDALVADFAGLTRDRKYGVGKLGGDYLLIDTGGLGGEEDTLDTLMAEQTWRGIEEADSVVFMVDARQGLTAADEGIAARLRQTGKPVYIAVNKTDGLDATTALAEFYGLGFESVVPIAASQRRGLNQLMALVLPAADESALDEEELDEDAIKLAFVGRPNVGKSTLINRILGEQRVVVSDVAGTTRDSIFIPFERDGQKYVLIDTAGVRRRGKVKETVEKFSIVKTLDAIDRADVVINVLDAQEGITDQDVSLIGMTLDAGRAVVVVLNKWDGLEQEERDWIKNKYQVKLPFLDFAERFTISALHGSGVGLLYDAVKRAYDSARIDVSTSRLTQILEKAVFKHQPPMVQGRRIKLRYAHQGGRRPPLIVVHGNQTDKLPGAYKRYLENVFRETLKLKGTPVRFEFKTGSNPYASKKSRPLDRKTQLQRRQEGRNKQ